MESEGTEKSPHDFLLVSLKQEGARWRGNKKIPTFPDCERLSTVLFMQR